MKASHPTKRNFLQLLAAIPAVFVAVVSHFVACPACWPLVGGPHFRAGIDFASGNPTDAAAVRRLSAPGDCAACFEARRHLPPFILGLIAAAFVLVGKFLLNATAVTVVGIAILAAAYVWSYRARRCD
jgi:hypothetical protein